MSLDKLFGVLVVGGALLAVGACSDEGKDDGRGPITGQPDAAPAQPDATSDSLELCFCDQTGVDACCVRDANGTGTLKAGFECCWSTTC